MPIARRPLYKYDLKHKGRKMTLSVFFIPSAFLGFSQVFSSVMTQVIERMFETIGLHSPTPDLGDNDWEIMDHALVCWILVPSQGNSSVGRFARSGTVWQDLRHCHDGYLVWSLPCQFWPALFVSIIGLGFGYIAFEYNIWWAIFSSHFPITLWFPKVLHYVAYHVDEGLANWFQIGVLAIGSIVSDSGSCD